MPTDRSPLDLRPLRQRIAAAKAPGAAPTGRVLRPWWAALLRIGRR